MKDLPIYIKQEFLDKMYPRITVMEVTEQGWIEIEKVYSKNNSYETFKISKDTSNLSKTDHWEESWIHKPENQGTKEEFDSLKFEFLNWINQNLER